MSIDVVARVSNDEFGRPPASYADLIAVVRRYARELIGCTVVNHPTQLAITVTRTSLSMAIRPGVPVDLLLAIPALPEMLSWGRYVRTVANLSRRGDVRKRHVLAATVEVGRRPVEMLLVVCENYGGQCFFERMLKRIAPPQHRDVGGATPDDTVGIPEQADDSNSSSRELDSRAPISVADAGAAQLSPRDKAYLDNYYDLVNNMAQKYFVDPKLVLATGIESGFGTSDIFQKDKDAFGMSGGSINTQPAFPSYQANVQRFFSEYGPQIWGTDSDASVFTNALQGQNAAGIRVPQWKVYNSHDPSGWRRMIAGGIRQMQRSVPLYLQQRNGG